MIIPDREIVWLTCTWSLFCTIWFNPFPPEDLFQNILKQATFENIVLNFSVSDNNTLISIICIQILITFALMFSKSSAADFVGIG